MTQNSSMIRESINNKNNKDDTLNTSKAYTESSVLNESRMSSKSPDSLRKY